MGPVYQCFCDISSGNVGDSTQYCLGRQEKTQPFGPSSHQVPLNLPCVLRRGHKGNSNLALS